MDDTTERIIKKMLWEDWDPIGVNHFPEASNEYNDYASSLAELLIQRASIQDIFGYLWNLETVHMGLEGNKENTMQFAQKIRKVMD